MSATDAFPLPSTTTVQFAAEYTPPNPRTRRRYAFHEAGHAVAAVALGGRITRIQIAGPLEPVFDDRGTEVPWAAARVDSYPAHSDHYAETKRMIDGDAAARERLFKRVLGHVVVLMAGPAAEGRFIRPRRPRLDAAGRSGARADYAAAAYLLKEISKQSDIPEFMAIADDAAHTLFADPEVWAAITAVANAALEGVQDGDELTAIARSLLPAHLPCAPLFREGYQLK